MVAPWQFKKKWEFDAVEFKIKQGEAEDGVEFSVAHARPVNPKVLRVAFCSCAYLGKSNV